MDRARERVRPLNYLRAWREFRRMTQAELAAIIGTEGSVISLLESGDRGLSDKWLRRLAPALATTPGLLLDFPPDNVDDAVLQLWNQLPEAQQSEFRDWLLKQRPRRGREEEPPQHSADVIKLPRPRRARDEPSDGKTQENRPD
jgi:transcriptional regulator with XRE-family HTH domain